MAEEEIIETAQEESIVTEQIVETPSEEIENIESAVIEEEIISPVVEEPEFVV